MSSRHRLFKRKLGYFYIFNETNFLKDSTESKKYMESYEKVLIEWSSVKDNLPYDEGVQVESTDLFKLIINKYSNPLVEAFVNSRLSNNNDLDNVRDNLK